VTRLTRFVGVAAELCRSRAIAGKIDLPPDYATWPLSDLRKRLPQPHATTPPTKTPPTKTPTTTWRTSACAVLAFALAVRLAVLLLPGGAFQADADGYRRLAITLRQTGMYGYQRPLPELHSIPIRPTAFRPPLYPLVLATLVTNDALPAARIGLLHLALGLATVWLTHRLAIQAGMGPWSALAAMLVVCDPLLMHQSTQLMTETFATFLAVSVLALCGWASRGDTLQRPPVWKWGVMGGVLGLACLCRPPFLIWLGFIGLLVLAADVRRRNLSRSLVLALSATAVLAPWVVRNQLLIGKPIIGTTHGGYTLWLGNNPDFYQFLRTARWGDVWDSRPIDQQQGAAAERIESETERDRWAYAQAFSAIKKSRRMFAYACLVRVGRLWAPLPHRPYGGESTIHALARYSAGAWNAALLGLAVMGVWRLRRDALRSPWVYGLLLALALTCVHTVFWSNIRMRAPVVPLICLLAAYGGQHLRHRKKTQPI